MSLSKEYAEMVRDQSRQFRFVHPLISGAEFNTISVQKSRWMQEYTLIQQKAKIRNWQNLPDLLEPLHDPDTAIVITDIEEKIEWVNTGFSKMTGYQAEEAIGRSPKFLQGKETNMEDVRHFRQAIKKLQPFSSEILNYRKNGEAYTCSVSIFPLFNATGSLMNFIAIEKEAV